MLTIQNVISSKINSVGTTKTYLFLRIVDKKKQTKYIKTTSYKFLENVVSLLNYNFEKYGLLFLFIL